MLLLRTCGESVCDVGRCDEMIGDTNGRRAKDVERYGEGQSEPFGDFDSLPRIFSAIGKGTTMAGSGGTVVGGGTRGDISDGFNYVKRQFSMVKTSIPRKSTSYPPLLYHIVQ